MRAMHNGKLYDPTYFKRDRGEGIFADQIQQIFKSACKKNNISDDHFSLNTAEFKGKGVHQLSFFE